MRRLLFLAMIGTLAWSQYAPPSGGGAGGVTSVAGTANQITVSGATGSVTFSIPTNPTLPGNTTGTFIGNVTGNVSGTSGSVSGGYVSSFNARTGAVVPATSDYTWTQIADFNTVRTIATRLTVAAGTVQVSSISGGTIDLIAAAGTGDLHIYWNAGTETLHVWGGGLDASKITGSAGITVDPDDTEYLGSYENKSIWDWSVTADTFDVGGGADQRGVLAQRVAVVEGSSTVAVTSGGPGYINLSLVAIGAGGTPSVGTCGTIGTGSTNMAGFITSDATGSCVSVMTFAAVTATTGWSCGISNATTANLIRQTGSSTTTATFTGTTVTGDVLRYTCAPY